MRASAIYRGSVRHERLEGPPHAFEHGVYLLYLDLDELPELTAPRALLSGGRPGRLRFERADYFGEADTPLKEAVLDRVELELGRRPAGRVGLLTQARVLGFVFNPVSFYYCFDAAGDLDAVLAEITNTPWKERHVYVVGRRGEEGAPELSARFAKRFHVSPFFDMDLTYAWRFSTPGERLEVSMTNLDAERPLFRAGFVGERRELCPAELRRARWRSPLQPQRVVAAIYLHAARLWTKGARFHPHPDLRAPEEGAGVGLS